MSRTQTYLDKKFVVANPDARIRRPNDLLAFETYSAADSSPAGEQIGNFKRIPKGAQSQGRWDQGGSDRQ